MFINKTEDGYNNLCGKNIAAVRKQQGKSQRQLAGLDVDKNAIQRIEAGKRFVTDIELVYFASVLDLSFDELLCTGGNL